ALHTLQQGPELRGVEKQLPLNGTIVEASTNWVVDSTGERVGVVEVFDDLTTIRHLEERFEQQKTLSALGEMASAVAHELRNPLAGIGGFAAILKEELADEPDRARLVDKLMHGVHDLEKVATNLLFLTRRTEIRRDETDLRSLLVNLGELFEAEVLNLEGAIEIRTDLPEETIMLAADAEQLKMIFTNLGRNAIIALDGKGTVEVGLQWRLLNNKVLVTIADNGCGIEPDNVGKLFNPFFTTRAQGTGLGLALVKKAVDLHKGKIWVESVPDEGTTFFVELPIRPYQPEQ
ncbi:nitrogen regulation protein NR(II), partial [Calditrichota bacterium]